MPRVAGDKQSVAHGEGAILWSKLTLALWSFAHSFLSICARVLNIAAYLTVHLQST